MKAFFTDEDENEEIKDQTESNHLLYLEVKKQREK